VAAIAVLARPVRGMWKVRPTGGDDGHPRDMAAGCGVDPPPRPLATDMLDLAVENGMQVELRGVAFQIGDDLGARGIAWVTAWHRQAGQSRMAAIGVQV